MYSCLLLVSDLWILKQGYLEFKSSGPSPLQHQEPGSVIYSFIHPSWFIYIHPFFLTYIHPLLFLCIHLFFNIFILSCLYPFFHPTFRSFIYLFIFHSIIISFIIPFLPSNIHPFFLYDIMYWFIMNLIFVICQCPCRRTCRTIPIRHSTVITKLDSNIFLLVQNH